MNDWYTPELEKALEIIGGVEWEHRGAMSACQHHAPTGLWTKPWKPQGQDWRQRHAPVTYDTYEAQALIEKALRECLNGRVVSLRMELLGSEAVIWRLHECRWHIVGRGPTFLAALVNTVLAVHGEGK